ncbi:MAG: HEAT repeat domain-containing protein [Methanomicrobiaceae archaeon]|nr:HEAT repeat domain-containing protein [Methanomicrobiaceae archaeon]
MTADDDKAGRRYEKQEKRLKIFIAHLDHDEAPYRWGAAEALGRMRDERAVEPLIGRLDDDDWRVRLKAAWSLGQIGDPRALPHLRRLMKDPREVVADMAGEAVRGIQMRMLRKMQEKE